MGATASVNIPVGRTAESYPDSEDDWTVEHWKRHALYLRRMARELTAEVAQLKARASRRKTPPRPKPIYPSSPRQDKAWEVLRIRAELEAKGQKVTDLKALEEWCRRQSKPAAAYRAKKDRTTINAMSKIRQRLRRTGITVKP